MIFEGTSSIGDPMAPISSCTKIIFFSCFWLIKWLKWGWYQVELVYIALYMQSLLFVNAMYIPQLSYKTNFPRVNPFLIYWPISCLNILRRNKDYSWAFLFIICIECSCIRTETWDIIWIFIKFFSDFWWSISVHLKWKQLEGLVLQDHPICF